MVTVIICSGCGLRKGHYFYGLCRWCYDNLGSGAPRQRHRRDEERVAQDQVVCNPCMPQWETNRDLESLCGTCRIAIGDAMEDIRERVYAQMMNKKST